MTSPSNLFGLLAEFVDAEELVRAAARTSAEGYREVEAYAPLPVEGLAEALEFRRTRMPEVVLTGGVIGAICGFALQYYVSVVAYPLNIGGRPLMSWPSFVPVIFEMTVLFAALAAVLGMLALNGLPRPHHPLFAIGSFDLSSALRRQGRFAEALDAAREAASIDRDLWGADHPEYAIDLTRVGELELELGRLAEAEASLDQALRILRAQAEPSAMDLGDAEVAVVSRDGRLPGFAVVIAADAELRSGAGQRRVGQPVGLQLGCIPPCLANFRYQRLHDRAGHQHHDQQRRQRDDQSSAAAAGLAPSPSGSGLG